MVNTTWTLALDAWADALRAAGRPATTVNLRLYHLRRLAAWAGDRGPWSLTLDDLHSWLAAHDWQAETRRSYRASLRGFWGWGVLTGRTSVDVARLLAPVTPAQPRPRPAPVDDVVTALREADRRVLLMLRLAVELGMRRGEVSRVHSDDLLRDLLGWSLRVHGKGARDRIVSLPDALARELRRLPAGWAFPGNDHGHLSARWVGTLVGRMLPVGVTMHQLRHRFATDVHRSTGDVLLVQRLLGHASPATTQRYIAPDDEAARAAVLAHSARWAV